MPIIFPLFLSLSPLPACSGLIHKYANLNLYWLIKALLGKVKVFWSIMTSGFTSCLQFQCEWGRGLSAIDNFIYVNEPFCDITKVVNSQQAVFTAQFSHIHFRDKKNVIINFVDLERFEVLVRLHQTRISVNQEKPQFSEILALWGRKVTDSAEQIVATELTRDSSAVFYHHSLFQPAFTCSPAKQDSKDKHVKDSRHKERKNIKRIKLIKSGLGIKTPQMNMN